MSTTPEELLRRMRELESLSPRGLERRTNAIQQRPASPSTRAATARPEGSTLRNRLGQVGKGPITGEEARANLTRQAQAAARPAPKAVVRTAPKTASGAGAARFGAASRLLGGLGLALTPTDTAAAEIDEISPGATPTPTQPTNLRRITEADLPGNIAENFRTGDRVRDAFEQGGAARAAGTFARGVYDAAVRDTSDVIERGASAASQFAGGASVASQFAEGARDTTRGVVEGFSGQAPETLQTPISTPVFASEPARTSRVATDGFQRLAGPANPARGTLSVVSGRTPAEQALIDRNVSTFERGAAAIRDLRRARGATGPRVNIPEQDGGGFGLLSNAHEAVRRARIATDGISKGRRQAAFAERLVAEREALGLPTQEDRTTNAREGGANARAAAANTIAQQTAQSQAADRAEDNAVDRARFNLDVHKEQRIARDSALDRAQTSRDKRLDRVQKELDTYYKESGLTPDQVIAGGQGMAEGLKAVHGEKTALRMLDDPSEQDLRRIIAALTKNKADQNFFGFGGPSLSESYIQLYGSR